ncbi:MAG: hypothetical protein V1765_03570 [bacterium]
MKQFFAFIIALSLCLAVGSSMVWAQSKDLTNAFGKSGSMLSTVGDNAGYDINQRTIDPIIANIISVVLSFLGVIFLILMIYGGYTWMTATGNEQQITKARTIIVAALIGVLITVAAYAITYFVFFRAANRLLK